MPVEDMIGSRIAQYRRAAGMSQTDLGRALSERLSRQWPRQSVWSAEHGKRTFTARELVALVDILNIPSFDVLFGHQPGPAVTVYGLRGEIDLTDLDALDVWARATVKALKGVVTAISERTG